MKKSQSKKRRYIVGGIQLLPTIKQIGGMNYYERKENVYS